TDAPKRMMNTIEVMAAVEIAASRRMRNDRRHRRAASTIAPTAPTDAASVGVAMPPRIEPRTAAMSASGGTSATTTSFTRSFFCSGGTGVAGQDSGENIALKIIHAR